MASDLLKNFSIVGRVAASVALVLAFSLCLHAQTFTGGYYRLTTKWLGEERALDVIDERPQLAATANAAGQFWKLTPVGDGFYKLTTKWLGDDRALDVINDGSNNKLQFARSANVSGQYWKIAPLGGGYYRLTTNWLGDGKSLDVVNDGKNTSIQMASTAIVSGQFWKLTPVLLTNDTSAGTTSYRNFKQVMLYGFSVKLDPAFAESEIGKEVLALLSKKLEWITELVTAKQAAQLKTIPIWIEVKHKGDIAVWYHASKDWLVANGYPGELVKSVEITSVRNFLDWQKDQPMMLLHEFAHGYQDMFLPELQGELEAAYRSAVSGRKYDKVAYVNGGMNRAYALNDKTEYFAELTEAYFGKNDYYPFVREELKEFDALGYKLMEKAWGPR